MKQLWVLCSLFFTIFLHASLLQNVIDHAASGSKITLPKGTYKGNITINKPLILEGKEKGVMIEGEDNGTVITITASHVTLQNLTVTHSGNRIEKLDAAIRLEHVSDCTIQQCSIKKVHYGIILNQVTHSRIDGCSITSRPDTIPNRGDAVKFWYCSYNILQNSTIAHTRDVIFLFSQHNRVVHNRFDANRIALHFENSHHNTIADNSFYYNEVAILVMGAKESTLSHNLIQSCGGVAGIGVVADKVAHFIFENNILKYNTKAMYIDAKRTEHGLQRFIKNNQFLYNGEAFHFHSDIINNMIKHNLIKGNLEDIVRDVKGSKTDHNQIAYNYWDRYEGFDRNRDNIGDTPYLKFYYTDQLWFFNNKLKFFYATPVMSLVDFLLKLAPFSQPILLLKDTKPLLHPHL